MKDYKIAVVGVGATGAVLAAALISQHPETVIVRPKQGLKEVLSKRGLTVSGAITYQVPVKKIYSNIGKMKNFNPNLIFLSTKTFHLSQVLDELEEVFQPGTKIVSTHNGLGIEDLIAERFGDESAFRMSLNYGVAFKDPGVIEAAFFNPPNHLGALVPENHETGEEIAGLLTAGGLKTEYVEDIKLYVWKKMIIKCTMASICAVTDKTIKDALDFPPTRAIADACFREALAVAKGLGYDIDQEYLEQARGYLEKVGVHKDSMCHDIANKTPTEIDFLGAKVVEYARENGIPTPFYETMTNLVKAIEDNYLQK